MACTIAQGALSLSVQKHHWKRLCILRPSTSASRGLNRHSWLLGPQSFWQQTQTRVQRTCTMKGHRQRGIFWYLKGWCPEHMPLSSNTPKRPSPADLSIFWGQKTDSKFLHKVCRSVQIAPRSSQRNTSWKPSPSPQHNLSNPNPKDCPHRPSQQKNYLQNLPFRESPALYSEPCSGQISRGPFLPKAAASGLRRPPLYWGEGFI